MGKLTVLDGKLAGTVFLLRSRNIIGRHFECSFVIKDKGISGKHCKIDMMNKYEFNVTDLNSSNGTYVNNKRITTEKLKFGDVITLGTTRLLFQAAVKMAGDSTIMVDMQKYAHEMGSLMHCEKPMAKEWRYCPYCGEHLQYIDRGF